MTVDHTGVLVILMLTMMVLTMMGIMTMVMLRIILCWQVDTGADQQQEAATLERRHYITRPQCWYCYITRPAPERWKS